ncbi:MAG: hypothetical protein DI582_00320 [Azospirillum brasilense]|nr:MAG: hypothetical protein DI582_00320 [Azospirillum brasilense]
MMRWQHLGQIFRVGEHALGEGIVSHAQSPQALVMGDRVRIYFSTRRQSADGKFLSTVRYAEFDKTFAAPLHVATHEVIAPGALGTFDEHGIFPMHVQRVGDAMYGYTSGWSRRKAVDVDMQIGLAISRDGGVTFERAGPGPILGPSLHEPCMVGDGFVLQQHGQFHMWYIFGTGWQHYAGSAHPERIYKIAHARSADGIAWHKPNDGQAIIPNVLGDDECQALPTVLHIGGRYHMLFCYRYASDFRSNPARGYRLGYAHSTDLLHWTRDDAALGFTPSGHGWDSSMQCYPHLFAWDKDVYLLYNGNHFGREGFGLARLEGIDD